LATVYGIVKQHHGWVEVQSQVNHGTTFHIFLPAQAAINRAKIRRLRRGAKIFAPGRETILVVDDEPDLRELVAQDCWNPAAIECSGGWFGRRSPGTMGQTPGAYPSFADRYGHAGRSERPQAGRPAAREDPRLRVIYTSGYTAGQAGTELANVEARNFLAKPYRPSHAPASRARLPRSFWRVLQCRAKSGLMRSV
jgi:two-component system, cell cycle sensor histidine kinase and response regulator CckA